MRPIPNILQRIGKYVTRVALIDGSGPVSYGSIDTAAQRLSKVLIPLLKQQGGKQPTVAYLHPRDRSYVVSKLASWHSGAIGVPLAESYPPSEYEYLLQDSGASAVLVHPSLVKNIKDVADKLNVPLIESVGPTDAEIASFSGSKPQEVDFASIPAPRAPSPTDDSGAMLIYTSGTTGRPKGVLVTHGALETQVTALTTAWGWRPDDHILNVLPLHHVHGVVAVLLSALHSGATCEMAPKFDSAKTWEALTRTPEAPGPNGPLTLFMAVPTVYAKLVEAYDKAPAATQAAWSAALKRHGSTVRLMVSGSAALPEPLSKRWTQVRASGCCCRCVV